MQFEFIVPDMTCGHCVKAITEAVREVDAGADTRIVLDTHRVSVASQASRAALESAIQEAGYTVQPA